MKLWPLAVTAVALCAAHRARADEPSSPGVPAATKDRLRGSDARIAELEHETKLFELHGYFRSGFGLNSNGGRLAVRGNDHSDMAVT